jgi:hypothetical protein
MFHDYFPVCILHHKISDELADRVEDAVTPHLHKLQRETPIVDHGGAPYTSLDTMYTDFWDNKILVHELVPDFFPCVQEAVLSYQEHTSIVINPNFKIRYWTQNYEDRDSHDIHNHGIHGISGIYFMRANDKAGPTRFYNPNQVAGLVKHMMTGNRYCTDTVDIWPVKGTMLIFPSYLKHKVVASGPGVIRTSIAFDICPG